MQIWCYVQAYFFLRVFANSLHFDVADTDIQFSAFRKSEEKMCHNSYSVRTFSNLCFYGKDLSVALIGFVWWK